MKVSCVDCACADRDKMKCYPNDRDCKAEYDLDEEDFTTKTYCGFFKPKEKTDYEKWEKLVRSVGYCIYRRRNRKSF